MLGKRSLAATAVLLIALAASDAAHAALPAVAVRAGMSAAVLHEDGLAARARRGLACGLGARLPLSAEFSLQPEIWYLQKGMHRATLWERIDLETRYQTVSIPVLLALDFPATRFESRAFIGPAIDLLLGSEIRRRDRGVWQDVTSQDESVFFSLVVGGGTRWRRLDLDVRYQHGLSRLTDFNYREFADIVPDMHPFKPAYDRTWILTAGLWF